MGLLDDKSYFVLGLGISGRAVSALLAGKGREVIAFDENASVRDEYARSITGESFEPRINIAPADGSDVSPAAIGGYLSACDRMVLSPGVPLDHPLVEAARGNGMPVDSEIEVAFHFTGARIVGVTGTNGKSTTVGVIGSILKTAGVRSVVAGNVGTPFSTVVGGGEAYDVIVLELSSFQLDTITEFKADIAVLLNVTPDHLDRYHHSFDEYAASKARILNRFDENGCFVYNADDPVSRRIAGGHEGLKIPFSSSGTPDSPHAVYLEGDAIHRAWHGAVDEVLNVGDYEPVGVHNLENAMAAVAAATALDVPLSDIRGGLRSYRPLPHRMEPVRTVGGVVWINDSKATNVDATIKSLISIEGNVVLILGGRDKEGDFSALVPHLGRVRRIIMIGEARRVIRAALNGRCELEEADTMEEAVEAAAQIARPGDTVLLAPACASFDMFDDYQHRGEAFRSCVDAL
jgi:UDP-N-acetylmuramoylalanine--D-glutamate ligase